VAEWFEELDDRLWLLPDEEGEEEARFIRRALRLRRGSRVLDIPCGAGRIAVHLALAGCRVTGADIRRRFVARARRRFRAAGVDGAFVTGDMRDADWESEFNGIYNWGGSFGYFGDEQNADLIKRFARALRPGGRLLVDLCNREWILRHFLPEVTTEVRVSRNRWNARRKRIESKYFIDGVHEPKDRSSMRLYTPSEITRMFERGGLRVDTLYGDWQGSPYTRSGRRLIAVGWRERPPN